MFGLFLKYRAHGLPDLVVRRPSLPSLGLSPKQLGLVSEAVPHHSAATASLENDNYNYGGPEQLAAMGRSSSGIVCATTTKTGKT